MQQIAPTTDPFVTGKRKANTHFQQSRVLVKKAHVKRGQGVVVQVPKDVYIKIGENR